MSTTRSPRSAADARRRHGRRDERGTGVVTSVAAVTTLLLVVLVATQVAYALHARSAVTAAAYDAARVVAGADGGPAAVPVAEARARAALGRFGDRVRFEWTVGRHEVRLRTTASLPGLLPPTLRRPLAADRLDRTVTVRTERVR